MTKHEQIAAYLNDYEVHGPERAAVLEAARQISNTKWDSFALDSDRDQIVSFAIAAASEALRAGRLIGRAEMAEDMRRSLEGIR